jgi:hypothetical protein
VIRSRPLTVGQAAGAGQAHGAGLGAVRSRGPPRRITGPEDARSYDAEAAEPGEKSGRPLQIPCQNKGLATMRRQLRMIRNAAEAVVAGEGANWERS